MDNSKIVNNVFWKFAERISAQVVSLIVSIILARILMPEEYGVIALVMVFITIANVFVTAGIPSALIQKKDADDLDFSSVFYFNFVLSLVIYLILFFVSPVIADFYESSQLNLIIRILGIRIIVASVNSVQHAYVSRKMIFKKYFLSTFFGTVISAIAGIIMAYTGCGVWALVAQYMINTIVDTIVLFFTISWKPKLMFSLKRTIKLFKFGWKILVQSLLDALSIQLRSLIVGKVYTKSDLGYYTKGQQFPSLIITNINASISSVLFPAVSNIQNDTLKVKELLRKAIRLSSFIIFPMLTGLAIVAEPFISIVLTDKWLDCVPFLQLFCLTSAISVEIIMRHQALTGIGKSNVFLIEGILYDVFSIVVLLLMFKINVFAIALVDLIGVVFMLIIVVITSKIYNKYPVKEQFLDFIPIFLGCVAFAVPVWFMNYINISNYIKITIQIVTGVTIYFAYSYFIKSPELLYVSGYLKNIFKRKKKDSSNSSDINNHELEEKLNSSEFEKTINESNEFKINDDVKLSNDKIEFENIEDIEHKESGGIQ